jgi:hypothetical protein
LTLSDGLGLVHGLAVTPRLLPDQRWPQLFQLARAAGTTRWASASTSGRRSASRRLRVCDRRQHRRGHRWHRATWTTGGAIGGAWLVVDTFVDGDAVVLRAASPCAGTSARRGRLERAA